MKLWRVIGVLVLIGAEALLYGYSYPFFSLALEKHGLATWLIGLNASLAGAGILIVGPVLPALIDRLGLRPLVAALFAISLASFAAILAADNLIVWFAARFVMGACFAALWTTTEIWLNGVVDERHRGRIIGASGTLYAACQFVGPLVLGGVGVSGSLPLIVAMLPLAVGVVVALSIRSAKGEVEEEESLGDTKSLKFALSVAGALVAPPSSAVSVRPPCRRCCRSTAWRMVSAMPARRTWSRCSAWARPCWSRCSAGWPTAMVAASRCSPARSSPSVTSLLLPFSTGSVFALFPVLFVAGGAISASTRWASS